MKFLTRRINEWLIVFISFAIISVALSMLKSNSYLLTDVFQYLFNTHPTSIILSQNAISAIEIFRGGNAIGYQFEWKTISMLLNIILYLMIAPFLLYKGYKNAKAELEYSKPWYWYIGAIIFIGSLSIIPYEFLHINYFEKNKEQVLASKDLDMMRAELYDVGFAIAQFEIVEDGIDDSFSFSKLSLKDLKYEYAIQSIKTDTLVTIISTSNEFENHSVTAEIRPYSKKLIKLVR